MLVALLLLELVLLEILAERVAQAWATRKAVEAALVVLQGTEPLAAMAVRQPLVAVVADQTMVRRGPLAPLVLVAKVVTVLAAQVAVTALQAQLPLLQARPIRVAVAAVGLTLLTQAVPMEVPATYTLQLPEVRQDPVAVEAALALALAQEEVVVYMAVAVAVGIPQVAAQALKALLFLRMTPTRLLQLLAIRPQVLLVR